MQTPSPESSSDARSVTFSTLLGISASATASANGILVYPASGSVTTRLQIDIRDDGLVRAAGVWRPSAVIGSGYSPGALKLYTTFMNASFSGAAADIIAKTTAPRDQASGKAGRVGMNAKGGMIKFTIPDHVDGEGFVIGQ